jgi:hypothetical protein
MAPVLVYRFKRWQPDSHRRLSGFDFLHRSDFGRFFMSSMAISLIVFGVVVGGALLGMAIRAVLPEHHLSQDSKDIVKLGMGLIGTIAAMALGILVRLGQELF